MDSGAVCEFLFLGGWGALFLTLGILMRSGIDKTAVWRCLCEKPCSPNAVAILHNFRHTTDKTWFYLTGSLRSVPVLAFGFIPIGLGLLVMEFSLIGRDYGWLNQRNGAFVLFGVSFPLIFLGIVFAVWRPRWLKPRWYRWLEDNYGRILGELRKDAQRLEKAWVDRVRTQEGLEQWAEEVWQQHRADTWFD